MNNQNELPAEQDQPPTDRDTNRQDPKEINRYKFIRTAFVNCTTQTNFFAIGAFFRNQPIHKGAITAVVGGSIVGAMIGLLAEKYQLKQQNSHFALIAGGAILEHALLLVTMPLGAKLVSFDQDLPISTLIENQYVGLAFTVATTPIFSLLFACASYLYHGGHRDGKKAFFDTLQGQFDSKKRDSGTLELTLALLNAFQGKSGSAALPLDDDLEMGQESTDEVTNPIHQGGMNNPQLKARPNPTR